MKGRLLWWVVIVMAVVYVVDAENGTETPDGDDEDEPTTTRLETFEEYEKKMKNGANDLVRKILPTLMQNAAGSQISGPCMSSLMRIIGGLRQLREWALRFVDSCGKLPPGILEGTSLSLGDYDQCLGIKVGKKDTVPVNPEDVLFTGQYCLLENHRPEVIVRTIKEYENGNKDVPIAKTKTVLNMFVRYKHLTNNTFKLGICIPSKCSSNDIQQMLQSDTLKSIGRLEVAYCEGKDSSNRSLEQDIILGFFGFFGGCLFLGTFIDVFLRVVSNTKDATDSTEKSSAFQDLVRSVSLYSNALHLVTSEDNKAPLRVLCAFRVLTVMITIYSHTYGHIHELHFQKFSKPANFLKFFESFTFTGIANGSVGMDTVFFIAGITITYTRWRYATKKEHVKLNIQSLLLHRYFRMTAAQLLVMGLFFLFPLFGSGPLWTAYVGKVLDNCKDKWWLNILFISNFWSARNTCIYHFWILAVIMQLTLLSVIILWLLKWSQRSGICFSLFMILLGVIAVGIVTVQNELPGSMAFFMLNVRTATIAWRQIYSLAYDHVGPFCIGLLAGYYLAVKKDKLVISRKICALLWCGALAINSAVLFGLYEYRHGEKISLPLGAFYAVTHRNIWALGIAWFAIACSTGNGGFATTLMNARIFLFLDRLCYMAFLVHLPIMYYHSGILRERWYMGHFELMFNAIGYIVLSFVVAFWLYICFVRPYFFLEARVKLWFGSRKETSLKGRCKLQPSESITTSSNTSAVFENVDGCINLGYSKKLEGV